MNKSTRKELTEYLGKCWHEKGYPLSGGAFICKYCKEAYHPLSGFRTFTTPDDADALRGKMVERGDWSYFYAFVSSKLPWNVYVAEIVNYLMENFNELAGEWIGGRK